MDLAEFEKLLDRHGADLSQWPDSEAVEMATQLLKSSEDAGRLQTAEEHIARLLDRAMFVPSDELLHARILASTDSNKAETSTGVTSWIWKVLQPVLAAMPLVIGFYVGFTLTNETDPVEDVVNLATFEDHSEMVAFANE